MYNQISILNIFGFVIQSKSDKNLSYSKYRGWWGLVNIKIPGISNRDIGQTSSIISNKTQNLNVSRLVLQLCLPNPLSQTFGR